MRLKTRNLSGIKIPKLRMAILFSIMLIFCVIFFGYLSHYQFAMREEYAGKLKNTNTVTVGVPTLRGEISDVNGITLVSNKTVNNITLSKKQLPAGRENEVVLEVAQFFADKGIQYTDILPVSEYAGSFLLDQDFENNTEKQKRVRSFAKYYGMKEEDLLKDESALYNHLIYRYGLTKTNFSPQQMRIVAGIRFTADVSAFSSSGPCVLVADASDETIGKLSDSMHKFPGLAITPSAERYYNIDGLASHVLGRTGVIYAEDAEYYTSLGYSLDEIVGIEGAELVFEKYLRGKDGVKETVLSDGSERIIGENIIKEPKPGYTVKLTIDSEMQKIAEDSLERVIKAQAVAGNATLKQYDGEDANAGTVVVMDPRDGAVRVLANYPSYNLNTLSEDIAELSKDTKGAPFLNRALSGEYEPGSTYKIATAAAALHYGIVDENDVIYDKGEYFFHETYKPHCWVFDRNGTTHGYQTVLTAIQNSCNYYFFEVGEKMGIDKLNNFAADLGLGVKTGIELPEKQGSLVSPKSEAEKGLPWNPGYVLQAAIGQQHRFTPIQIASYISTVLNGGKRYRAHLFDSACDYSTGEPIEEYVPEVLSETEIPAQTLSILKEGMRRVMDDGTASSVFRNYKYPVGGKTGTAQVSKGSDNVIFVGFAPYDNPEIVVTVILEHGDVSSNAAKVAKDIFDCYFARLYPEDFGITVIDPEDTGTEEEQPTDSPYGGDYAEIPETFH